MEEEISVDLTETVQAEWFAFPCVGLEFVQPIGKWDIGIKRETDRETERQRERDTQTQGDRVTERQFPMLAY